MFWRYNRLWNALNKFVIVYNKTLGTAFAVILNICSNLRLAFFLQNIWVVSGLPGAFYSILFIGFATA